MPDVQGQTHLAGNGVTVRRVVGFINPGNHVGELDGGRELDDAARRAASRKVSRGRGEEEPTGFEQKINTKLI